VATTLTHVTDADSVPAAVPAAVPPPVPAAVPADVPAVAPVAVTDADSVPAAVTSWVLSLSCPDRPGIVHAVAGLLAEHGGNITESQQFGDALSGLFFMRVQVESAASKEQLETALRELAERFSMTWNLDIAGRRMRTVVLVSTAAHCLHDLLFRQQSENLPIDIVGVIGNHTDLAGLAEFYGVPFHHIPVTKATKLEAEASLLSLVADLDVELVVLARYMQILSDDLCRALAGRAINIHHSFLPSFKGARPYAQAHDRGVKLIGATAHYVTGDLDEGPIIEQDVERVDHSRTVEDLVALGQDVERRALARAVRWHAEHRVLLDGHRTIVFR
jgi:formyltetrahydrofolate deformylase